MSVCGEAQNEHAEANARNASVAPPLRPSGEGVGGWGCALGSRLYTPPPIDLRRRAEWALLPVGRAQWRRTTVTSRSFCSRRRVHRLQHHHLASLPFLRSPSLLL